MTGPLGLVGVDKYLHALAFGVLAGVLVVALAASPVDRLLAVAVVATVGYGLAVEVLQIPIPYRSFSLLDLGADALGGAAVALAWWGRQRWRRHGGESE